MVDDIQNVLDEIEQEEGVCILYACESGSRAWGFASEDSDFDVRFLYVRGTPSYLSIDPPRDVIERPISDELDVSGWDLPKALRLFRKSNPPLLEWLQSPTIYRETGTLPSRLRQLLPEYYSPASAMFHYLHMARRNFRDYLHGDEVWVKKYFYVLRPVLACLWIERGLGPVPVEFEVLVERLLPEGALRDAIRELLQVKRQGAELDKGPAIGPISGFLETEIARLAESRPSLPQRSTTESLDKLFLDILIEINGDSLI